MTTSFATLSKSQVVKHIWANRSVNQYTGKMNELNSHTDEELEAFYNACPITEEQEQTVSTDTVEAVSNINTRFSASGEQYFTIGLPLVETNGYSFRFAFGDKLVNVSSDVDLYKVHKDSPIAIGTIIEFNYDGAESFRSLTSNLLVANPDKNHPYRGSVCKSSNDIFAMRLLQKEEQRMKKKVAELDTADELGISVRKVRTVMSANLNTSIAESMKTKLG